MASAQIRCRNRQHEFSLAKFKLGDERKILRKFSHEMFLKDAKIQSQMFHMTSNTLNTIPVLTNIQNLFRNSSNLMIIGLESTVQR